MDLKYIIMIWMIRHKFELLKYLIRILEALDTIKPEIISNKKEYQISRRLDGKYQKKEKEIKFMKRQ